MSKKQIETKTPDDIKAEAKTPDDIKAEAKAQNDKSIKFLIDKIDTNKETYWDFVNFEDEAAKTGLTSLSNRIISDYSFLVGLLQKKEDKYI